MTNKTPEVSWSQKHEVPRKVLHGSIGLLTVLLYCLGYQTHQLVPVFLALLVPIATLEYARFTFPGINKLYVRVVGPLMRTSEKTTAKINGVIWYIVGLTVTCTLFPKDVAVLSVLLLSWADLAASTFGRAYGYLTPKLVGPKSLAGSLAAFLTGVATCYLMYDYLIPRFAQYNKPSDILWWPSSSKLSLPALAVATGLAAAVTELFPVIDDNMSIPVLSALALWVTLKATKIPDIDVLFPK